MQRQRRQVLAAVGSGLTAVLAGCESGGERTTTATQATLAPDAAYGYTHVQPSGNRVVAGAGRVDDGDPVRIATEGRPAWLVALPGDTGSHWTVVEESGRARTVRVADGEARTVTRHAPLPAGTPPVVRRNPDGAGTGLLRPPAGAADMTHPVVTAGGLVYVAADGDLVQRRATGTDRWSVDALPDGRLVHVSGSTYALYGERTNRYRHGALGDELEGGELVIFDAGEPRIVAGTAVDTPAVFEGLSPLAADLNGDGERELVATVADNRNGARVVVYDRGGGRLATGPVTGPGWRHQLAVADFGAGWPELAVTRKPHVDHVVEFYRLDGELSVTAEYPGVSTHTYGSHTVDGALAGDFDADGTTELLVPTTAREALVAVERRPDGAVTDWRLPLDGPLATNLTGVALPGGRAAVGAGTADGVTVWQG